MVSWFAETLRSLNARLGALVAVSQGDVSAGQDMPELGLNWLYDLEMLGYRRANPEGEEASRPQDGDEGDF